MLFLGTYSYCETTSEEEKPEYIERLESATDLLIDGELVESEIALKKLRKEEITLRTWGMASFNLGINLRYQEKYMEAIGVFEEVLKSKLNDRDPAPNIMEHFMNYHYKACMEISYNYELLRKYTDALTYMELAKTRYKFQDTCGTCFEQIDAEWVARVKHLEDMKTKESNQAE
ncbi:hypothetical protein Caka_0580 [Coraliomargarita akajimensis DSM 45221]|uniref:Tetratricopeptide repeat protein n=2 Tax=Coraliomargarita TaxID=442430 RepID=D5ENU6_CORAD|nr:hypothetical protein Caka_0580 [Coraliomargarita akajimensis DSM 45221]